MELIRIGDKLISLDKIGDVVHAVLEDRSRGLSQGEAGRRHGLDRSFVSRLESIGEIRRGQSVALIGFPVANAPEVRATAERRGVDFVWLMTDSERRRYAQSRNGIELVNEIMATAAKVRAYDVVVLLASNARIRLLEALLEPRTVIPVVLGETPLDRDVMVDTQALDRLLAAITASGGRA